MIRTATAAAAANEPRTTVQPCRRLADEEARSRAGALARTSISVPDCFSSATVS